VTTPAPLDVETIPFARVLVPYDGSAPSETSLAYGIALAQRGAALDIVHVIDESPIVAESSTTAVAFDPTPLMNALEDQGRALLDAARARCRAAGVEAQTRLIREFPVAGIDRTAEENGDALIVLGTHARTGLSRTFLGSTTEGVLRSSQIPVLAVHGDMVPPERLFTKLLVAIDESDPSDAAVALAARIVRACGSAAVICNAFDFNDLLEKAGTYGYDPTPLLDGLRENAKDIVDRALAHGGFPAGTAVPSIVEEEPARGIVAEAARVGADLLVVGSHGRRGLRRLFLGSVAEHVVRHSAIPVLIVRSSPTHAGR
jgi:nucleotide-binding universal stress UspA family protein